MTVVDQGIIGLYTLTVMCWLYIGINYVPHLTTYNRNFRGHPSYVIQRRVLYHMHKETDDLVTKIKGKNGVLSVDDEDLLWFIGTRIVGPSTRPYKEHWTRQRTTFSEVGQDVFVDKVLGHRVNGYFLDIGSGKGTTLSNTLYLEKVRNWTGLLVEPNVLSYKYALAYQRKAMSLNACVSAGNVTHFQTLLVKEVRLKIMIRGWPLRTKQKQTRSTRVECFPLPSILLTVNVQHIDYLSLNVKGMELDVLKTFPFGSVTVDVMTIPFRPPDMNTNEWKRYLSDIKEFMKDVGTHDCLGVLPRQQYAQEDDGTDVVFVRKGWNMK